MITISEVIRIQEILIERFGGVKGIRDRGILESALNRPYTTFDNDDLYPQASDKAAAILESLVGNHPFIDGNKRIGYVMMRLTLLEDNLDLTASQEAKYTLVIGVAKGEIKFEQIKVWIEQNSIQLSQ